MLLHPSDGRRNSSYLNRLSAEVWALAACSIKKWAPAISRPPPPSLQSPLASQPDIVLAVHAPHVTGHAEICPK